MGQSEPWVPTEACVKRVALALYALLFAACELSISTSTIDAGSPNTSALCADEPCLNGGVCQVTDEGFRCACEPGFEGELCELDVDDCDPNPCKNDGLCSDRVAGYTCSCSAGFTGVDCSTNIDECANQPCQHGGVCIDLVDGYKCDCPAGYNGKSCEVDVDDCATSPCENGGQCQDEVNGFTCICTEGNVGPTCSNQVEVCSEGLCQNGGTCEDSDEGYRCTCAAGYNGVNCEHDIDDCATLPCQNGASCVDEVNGYQCECPDGYQGVNCETALDQCNPNPCLNGGECSLAGDFFACACPPGYNGPTCGNNIDECASNPCANGGVCTDGVNGFTCECPDGFTGTTCSNEPNECPDIDPCANGGVCKDGDNGYTCDCEPGYIGATCETDVDDCEPNPCEHGTCADLVNGYQCSCDSGFDGPQCQNNIDDCFEEACQNGGICHDLVDAYECECAAGWQGDTCELDIDDCASNPCQNNGVCIDGPNSFTCECSAGFSGELCEDDHCDMVGACGNGACDGEGGCTCIDGWQGEDCREDIDECTTLMPCLHGGTCTNTDGSFMCNCPTGHTGVFCELCVDGYQDNDEDGVCCLEGYAGADCTQCEPGFEDVAGMCQRTCDSSPKDCGDHGVCDHSMGDTMCVCDPDYYGELCDSLIGMCSEGVCMNGACVTTSSNTYRCDCEPGYVGRNCETLDECVLAIELGETPCSGNGTCIDGDGSYTCMCATGWTGAACEEIEACEVAVAMGETPCSGHGTCIDDAMGSAYTCECEAGWLGADCGEEDNCVGHQCVNGTCVDGAGSYTCECAEDWEGVLCDTPEDDCAPNPCLHNGVCSNVGATFACDCAGTGYTGTTCEQDINECADAEADVCNAGNCANIGGGYTCQCPDGTVDVSGDGTNCAHVTALAAGARNTCAISAAGSLHCWGDNLSGQLGQGSVLNPAPIQIRVPRRVGSGTNWTKVSVGDAHVCGLRGGRLFCWGDNSYRQCGVSNKTTENTPVEIRSDLTWTDVSAGGAHTCALAGSELYCWGHSNYGQAGIPTSTVGSGTPGVDAPKQLNGTWSKVSAGGRHTCAINTSNELFCWGHNDSGQVTTGAGSVSFVDAAPIAVPVGNDGHWESVEAGPAHTCAVAGTQTYCWGEGSRGSLGNGVDADSDTPEAVTFASTLSTLAAGTDFSCGTVSSGDGFEIYCWGSNEYSLLLTGDELDVNIPTLVTTESIPVWSHYAVGDRHMCGAIGGLSFCWGNNSDGATGAAVPTVEQIEAPTGVKNAVITHSASDLCTPNPCKNGGLCSVVGGDVMCDCSSTGYSGPTCAVENDECSATPGICGDGICHDLLDDNGYSCTCPHGLLDVDETGMNCEPAGLIAAGVNHTCVLTETSRTLHCWGSNRYGQFGLGDTGTTDYYPQETTQTIRTPLRLRTIADVTTDARGWTHMVVGENITCGTLPNDQNAESLYCWGDNSLGQVGVGTINLTYNTAEPPVPTAATVVPSYHATPQLLDDTRTWLFLATSYATTCGIDSNHELRCWGFNRYGQVGNGSFGNTQIPDGTETFVPVMYSQTAVVAPPPGEQWVSVAPGNTTTCALTDMNNVYCWGRRNQGQTGTGGANNQSELLTPTKVNKADPQGFTGVWGDITHSCALVGDAAYCWGQGTSGGIGNGANMTQSSPTLVSGGLSFERLTLGSNCACGLVVDPVTTPQAYQAYCWGNNPRNILLTGAASANVPTAVNTTRRWLLLDLGPGHACGVDHLDNKLYCWGDNGLELGTGQGKIGSVPASVLGNIGLVGPVRAAPVEYPATP